MLWPEPSFFLFSLHISPLRPPSALLTASVPGLSSSSLFLSFCAVAWTFFYPLFVTLFSLTSYVCLAFACCFCFWSFFLFSLSLVLCCGLNLLSILWAVLVYSSCYVYISFCLSLLFLLLFLSVLLSNLFFSLIVVRLPSSSYSLHVYAHIV